MEIDIEYLENLSKLKFEESEKEKFKEEFFTKISFISEIKNIEIPNSIELDKAVSLSDLREDEEVESLTREKVLKNAPKKKDGCFQTPLVVE